MKDRTAINADQFLDRTDRSRGSIFWPYDIEYSDDFEVMQIALPADYGTENIES